MKLARYQPGFTVVLAVGLVLAACSTVPAENPPDVLLEELTVGPDQQADSHLLGNWSGEAYEIKGFPTKMGIQIYVKEHSRYTGHASLIDVEKNPTSRPITSLPKCANANVTIEPYAETYYSISFDGDSCEGHGKLRHRDRQLTGLARFNSGVPIFINLYQPR